MQSNGGVAEIGQASHHAVNLLLSGPAAGVIAGRHVGTVNGHENLITLDIGGTSADISVIPGRLLEMDARESRIGGYPILTPKLDVTAIGAGGGSIAWRDRGGAFNVGPRSAGAMPGPACYGRGGTDPTVTDAHVVLGRIDPDRFLDGRLRLDESAARDAVERIGVEFGLGLEDAALAILAILNANMVREVRIHSVRRGYDPRECALVAFGGAGPLHACEVAAQLEVPVILLPPAPGITSAMGLLATDLKYDSIRTVGVMLSEADRDALDRAFAEMERDLRARFAASDEPVLHREAACRYAGQGYELAVDCDTLGEDWRELLGTNFHERHRREYGFNFPGDPVEIINLRVTATRRDPHSAAHLGPRRRRRPGGRGDRHPQRRVRWRGRARGARRAHLRPRAPARRGRAPQPAIVNEMDSTVVISPGWNGVVAPDGTIRLEVGTMSEIRIDPVLLQIIGGELDSIAKEMAHQLIRSARSALIRESEDMGAALLNTRCEEIAESDNTPLHVGSLVAYTQGMMETITERGIELRPGDVLLHNHPYKGASHTPDIAVIAPVFHAGELIGFSGNTAHHLDIGGAYPARRSTSSTCTPRGRSSTRPSSSARASATTTCGTSSPTTRACRVR